MGLGFGKREVYTFCRSLSTLPYLSKIWTKAPGSRVLSYWQDKAPSVFLGPPVHSRRAERVVKVDEHIHLSLAGIRLAYYLIVMSLFRRHYSTCLIHVQGLQ